MALYEDDSRQIGPRRIETLYRDLSLYLDDSFMTAYLCYIATISKPHVVIVDPLATSADPQQFSQRSIIKSTFNYNNKITAEVILLPIHFPGHWELVIHDSRFDGTYYLDSLPSNPSRLDPFSSDLGTKSRINRIKSVICEIIPSKTANDIEIIVLNEADYTLQNDGVSCGYFVLLYSEAWLFNYGDLILESLDIDREKRRILWHVNELYSYSSDSVDYYPRIGSSEYKKIDD